MAALLVYRLNAYRVFPGLAVEWRLFRRERLREVSGFSVFMLMLDAAYKVNYSTDVLVIGAWLGAPAVALWAPAQRLTELTLRLSNQLSEALFPVVVDCDASQRAARLRTVFVHGTRLSLATVLPVAGGLALLAHPLLMAWIGPSFATTPSIVQILAFVVIVRVGSVYRHRSFSKALACTGGSPTLVGLMAVANLALSIALVAAARARRRGARHGGSGDARSRLRARSRRRAGESQLSFVELFRRRCGRRCGRLRSRASVLVETRTRLSRHSAGRGSAARRGQRRSISALFLLAVGNERSARIPGVTWTCS